MNIPSPQWWYYSTDIIQKSVTASELLSIKQENHSFYFFQGGGAGAGECGLIVQGGAAEGQEDQDGEEGSLWETKTAGQ